MIVRAGAGLGACLCTGLALGLAILAGAATAAPLPIPTQDGWDAARRAVETADGLRLTYVELGEAPETAKGMPVILIHGYTDNSRSWSLPAADLARALPGRRIIAVDLPGHGGSEAPPCCYGPLDLAHALAGVMDGLGIAKADLIGHSLGSMTAATLAASQPERVNRLVLVSSATTVPEPALDWLWQNVPALQAPIDPESSFMRDWFSNPNPVDEDFLARERAAGARVPKHVWTGVLLGLSAMDLAPLDRRITAPTSIFWGEKDALFDAASQERLRAAMPKASFHEMKGLGHNFFWEQPGQAAALFAAALTD